MSYSKNILVYISVFNGARYIRQTLESVARQSIKFHIVVGDNGSTDGTVNIVKDFEGVELIELGASNSLGDSLNRAFQLKNSYDFIFVLHADDIYGPNFIEESVNKLLSNKDAAMVHSRSLIIDSGGELKFSLKNKIRNVINFLFPTLSGNWGTFLLLLKNPIVAPSVGLNLKKIREERFSEDNTFLTDLYFWLSILKNGHKIIYNPKVSVFYRVHSDQLSENYKTPAARLNAYLKLKNELSLSTLQLLIIILNHCAFSVLFSLKKYTFGLMKG